MSYQQKYSGFLSGIYSDQYSEVKDLGSEGSMLILFSDPN